MRTGWWNITAALALGLALAACTRGKSSNASGDVSGDSSGAPSPAPPPAPSPAPAEDPSPASPDPSTPPAGPANPERPPPPVEHIAAGDEHTCVLFRGGAVRCWGAGARGRLGTGATATIGDDETPASIPDIALGGRAVQIVAGKEHTCALLDTGGVRCWGAARSGQLGYGNRRDIGDDETPASAGDVLLGEPAVQLTASGMHTCALLGSGRVRCWGLDTEGQLGLAFDPRTIGDDEVPTAVPAIDFGTRPGARIEQLASSFAHTCALLAGGTVRCWGPVLGAGVDKLTPAAARPPVALGAPAASLGTGTAATHTCAITTAGRVRCWGLATGGPRGHGKSIAVGVAPGKLPTPAELGDLPITGRVVQVAPGSDHTCVLTATGQVRCWGDSRFGILGQGKPAPGRVPVESAPDVALGGRAVEIAAGGFHACALLDTGRVRCWGWNRSGQLGYGTPENVGEQRPPAAAGDVPL